MRRKTPAFPHFFIPNTQLTAYVPVAGQRMRTCITRENTTEKLLTWNKFLAQLDFGVARFSLLTEDPWASWEK